MTSVWSGEHRIGRDRFGEIFRRATDNRIAELKAERKSAQRRGDEAGVLAAQRWLDALLMGRDG